MKKLTRTIFAVNCCFISVFSISAENITPDNIPQVKQHKPINAQHIAAGCVSAKWNKKAYINLEQSKFSIQDDKARNQLSLQLLHCLASPDSFIRDNIAFTGISQWLRNEEISPVTIQAMLATLLSAIASEVVDEHDVYQSFSALMLSEVIRVDRKSPFLSSAMRDRVVESSSKFLREINDYRGFDDSVGWRHQVAHTADVMLQLALNPEINKQQLTSMLQALNRQITPQENHFYIYGEPKRIARAVIYIFLNEHFTVQEWNEWIEMLVSPEPFEGWGEMYFSQHGLSKLHNTRGFLYAMYALIAKSSHEKLGQLVPALESAITKVN